MPHVVPGPVAGARTSPFVGGAPQFDNDPSDLVTVGQSGGEDASGSARDCFDSDSEEPC